MLCAHAKANQTNILLVLGTEERERETEKEGELVDGHSLLNTWLQFLLSTVWPGLA